MRKLLNLFLLLTSYFIINSHMYVYCCWQNSLASDIYIFTANKKETKGTHNPEVKRIRKRR